MNLDSLYIQKRGKRYYVGLNGNGEWAVSVAVLEVIKSLAIERHIYKKLIVENDLDEWISEPVMSKIAIPAEFLRLNNKG